MAKVSRKVAEKRPDEIIAACGTLYRTMTFQEITLKKISAETSISRPSIYNYFETKEEIFLALLAREYDAWSADLELILNGHDALGADEFARAMAESLSKRETLLKIQCMNLYEIEEYSRRECLTEFKKSYRQALRMVDENLKKFFATMTGQERQEFALSFFPFTRGIYPYVHPTRKQRAAMEQAGIPVTEYTTYELTYRCVRQLLAKRE